MEPPQIITPDEASGRACQNPRCSHSQTATRVCHHPSCMEESQGLPLLLCRPCDLDIHRQPEFSGHLVLDSTRKRTVSNKADVPVGEHEGGSEEDEYGVIDDQTDGLFVKHNSKIRNKSPSDLERKLKRKKALKKKISNSKNQEALEAALAQIADPEGSETAQGHRMEVEGSAEARTAGDMSARRDSGLGEAGTGVSEDAGDGDSPQTPGGGVGRVPVRRQSRVALIDGHFTVKFGSADGQREDLEVVAANPGATLREALHPVLDRRRIDMGQINVFIEKSRTPLPLESPTVFLVGNTVEVKEKDDKDGGDPSNQSQSGKQRPNSASKSGSSKSSKQSGRSSRRDSVGVVPVLLEPPPTKQRRGSLQLPFREHFFSKTDARTTEALKVYDDAFGSLRGRSRTNNLSIDDTFYPSASPQGTWSEGKKNKSQKLSVVGLFTPAASKDRERQDQLNEILSRYSSTGLPPLPELLALGKPRFNDAMLDMEDNWRTFVAGHEGMSKKQQERQEAVWELLQTEVSYIRQIRVIIDVFQNCLINVQQESFLNEIETERLFSNIEHIYECNCVFWQQYLLPVLRQAREQGTPVDPLLFKSGFVDHFPIIFQVYFKYFIEQKSCLEYAKSCQEGSELFKIFITWAEAQKQCNRLKMSDILVKPMQRLLKYSLLLQAILKHTDSERDRADIQEMIESVDKLCWAANNSLRRREDYEKLEAVRKTIDLYDAIEAPNDECSKIIQEYNGNFNLLAPMPGFRDGQPRSLLFHSSLRMKEAQSAKVDVDCLLFTDLILICKSNRRMERFKIIRPPMRLDQLVVNELRDKGSFLLIYMNEYHVPISAFAFHSDTAAIKGWLEKFREAQREFKVRRVQESAELERLRAGSGHVAEEVEYTPLTAVPSDLAFGSGSFPRSESMESADRFIPNLLTPTEPMDPAFHNDLGRSGSAGDIHARYPGSGPLRDASAAYTTSAMSPELSPSDRRPMGGANSSVSQSDVSAHNSKHKPVQTCHSVPNITVRDLGADANALASMPPLAPPPPSAAARHRKSADTIQNRVGASATSSSAATFNDAHRSLSQLSLSEQHSAMDEEELSRIKFNSRRLSRTEKRYHTADSIQEMKHQDKDSTIHKRFSWRTDVNDDHEKLKSKVLSSDSIRSIPSSSGVSSTGSLHLNPESDITEEVEGRVGGGGTDDATFATTTNTAAASRKSERGKLFSSSDAGVRLAGERYEEDGAGSVEDLNPESKQSKSKSTPDLVAVFNSQLLISEMQDGIASVEVTGDVSTRKYTQADIIKMKKIKHQILYDANVESSEV
ncbi:pleckstrin homology domain-containing family G member 5 [Aplysia californica]|uniref:Pleckstrin homology domain-containing family G member 5 n=1 Tax=Aplysia californica TaxID=6500 RepID=A0ABM1AB53_APLCA|nr:pleckstrin homology domain-containing family G member 5 [Aplysia californica]